MTQNDRSDGSSSYDAGAVAAHFDEYGIREWNRLIDTPVDEVSLTIHTHFLNQYVAAGSRVLEVGAGAGRFTQALVGQGVTVLVADISQVQLDLNKRQAHAYGFASGVEDWRQTDICDMGWAEAGSFDYVVAYGGPLSYVLDRRDVALQECMRVLRPGGTLLLSVMSLWGSAHRHLRGVLSIPSVTNRCITDSGDISAETFPERGGNYMHLYRAGELRDWLTRAGLTVRAMSASNCLSIGWEERLAEIRQDDEKWQELLRMELEACSEEGSLNLGTHLIAVAQKG